MSVPDNGEKENVLVGSLSAPVRMFLCTCGGSNKPHSHINSKPPRLPHPSIYCRTSEEEEEDCLSRLAKRPTELRKRKRRATCISHCCHSTVVLLKFLRHSDADVKEAAWKGRGRSGEEIIVSMDLPSIA